MKRQAHPFYPQLLMVDGNGLLHPRGFGLACHLGVLADLPTIGVGKNLHHVDGLTQSGMRQLLEASENCAKDLFFLTGNSGCTWGGALRSTPGSSKPIFISTGNRISLESSIKVVKMCCKYRVPESIRQADISSRAYLKNLEGSLMQHPSNEPGKEPSEDQQMTINLRRWVNLESTYAKGRAVI
ncbi:hypothetical protein QJS10_CPA05g02484 [Acorus calamus]|uniref:Endonuclease V n=1 Tax=Acorus calamus TaxID=4465 RepID=A0AAV9ET97_ACOCL|nr:hypothetical protein QJS10_CPA05g02484 [Acorus calamus]